MEEPFGAADLHTHTSLTDGMMDVGALLEYVETRTSLDVLAVTDHDDISGGMLARELAARHEYRVQVVVGAEVTTLEGHLLALFLERPVPAFQSLEATLRAIHRQGGIAVAPHPMSWATFSLGERALRRACSAADPDARMDAIETGNPTVAAKLTRTRVLALNHEVLLRPEVGGSDAHFLPAVGSGYTRFPGGTAADLRQAILSGQTEAVALEVDLRAIGYGDLVRQQVQSLVIHPTRSLTRPLLRFLRGAEG